MTEKCKFTKKYLVLNDERYFMKRGQDNVLVLMFFTSISTVFNKDIKLGEKSLQKPSISLNLILPINPI